MRKSFTLLELVIVIIIVATLVALGVPQLQGSITSARIAETYNVTNAIYKAEEMFYLAKGYRASADNQYGDAAKPSYTFLGYFSDQGQVQINEFDQILGVKIPGVESRFIYGVHYAGSTDYVVLPPGIFVRERGANFGLGIVYIRMIEGPNAGKIALFSGAMNPIAKYVKSDYTI